MTGDRRYEEVLDEEWEGGRPNTMDPYLDRLEKKGEKKVLLLMQKLFSLGRYDDAKKAVFDETYRTELYKEFHLA